jgi:hypothetical protein
MDPIRIRKQIKSLIASHILVQAGPILIAILFGILIEILHWDKLADFRSDLADVIDEPYIKILFFNNILVMACIRVGLFVVINICHVGFLTYTNLFIAKVINAGYYSGIFLEFFNIALNIIKLAISVYACNDFCTYRVIYGLILLLDIFSFFSYIKLSLKIESISNKIQLNEFTMIAVIDGHSDQ